jgi:hypothetical protein
VLLSAISPAYTRRTLPLGHAIRKFSTRESERIADVAQPEVDEKVTPPHNEATPPPKEPATLPGPVADLMGFLEQQWAAGHDRIGIDFLERRLARDGHKPKKHKKNIVRLQGVLESAVSEHKVVGLYENDLGKWLYPLGNPPNFFENAAQMNRGVYPSLNHSPYSSQSDQYVP